MMEQVDNMTLDDVLDVMKDFPIKPLGRRLVITVNSKELDGNLVLSNSEFSESQLVVAVGTHVTDIVPGNTVLLDVERMMEFVPNPENAYEKVGMIKIRPVEVNGRVYGIINENVVEAIDSRNE